MKEFVIKINHYDKQDFIIMYSNKDISTNHFLKINQLNDFNLSTLKLSHLDKFSILNGKLFIIERYIQTLDKIPGILLLDKTYGSFKDKFFYKLIPHNKHFPSCLVPYKKQHSFNKHTIHKYVLYRFKHWNNKHPVSEIVEVIGNVNDISSYTNYRLYCDNLVFSKRQLNKQCADIYKHNRFFSLFHNKLIEKDKSIFTIDPPNCTDFDDAVSIQQKDDITTIDIYISNVAYILDYFDLYTFITTQVSAIYLPDNVIHMLSNSLSTNICSLTEKTQKSVIVCSLTIAENEIIKTNFSTDIIYIHKNYSYDEPALLRNSDYLSLFKTVSNISSIKDSHELVEWLMIEMNYRASLLLKQHNIGVFRNNNSIKSTYFFHRQQTDNIFRHDALQKSSYLHITSPIRRIVDILNQISLLSCLELYPLTQKAVDFYSRYLHEIERINRDMRYIKYLESDIYFLKNITSHPDTIYTAKVLEHSLYIEDLNKYIYYKDIHVEKHLQSIIQIKLYLISEEITFQHKIKTMIIESR